MLLIAVISCGAPEQPTIRMFPSGQYTPPANNLLGSSFTVTCLPGFRLLGNSSRGDQTVRCDENSYWDWGDIHCVGKLRYIFKKRESSLTLPMLRIILPKHNDTKIL